MKLNSYFKKLTQNYSPRHSKAKHIFNAKSKIVSFMLCAVITVASGLTAFATSSDFSELDGSQAATLVQKCSYADFKRPPRSYRIGFFGNI